MKLALDNSHVDFRRDGSFVEQSLEKRFRAYSWARDCKQLRIATIPVALTLTAMIAFDATALGGSSVLLYIDIFLRLTVSALCLYIYFDFGRPTTDHTSLPLPFITTLVANLTVLFAAAIGANPVEISTPTVVTSTLIYWAFTPLRTKDLIVSSASLFIGYMAILLIQHPGEFQTLLTAAMLLTLINAIGFFHVRNRNISERKEMLARQNLKETSESLQREMITRIEAERHAGANIQISSGIFRACPIPLAMIDLKTQEILRTNTDMLNLLGYSDEGLLGKHLGDFFTDKQVFKETVQTLRKNRVVLQEEVRMQTKGGDAKWILISARQFSLPDREAVLSSFVDITDQKKRTLDLAFATEEARRANFAKSQFLATMSHELRTPLNAIIGFSDIIESEVFGKIENPRYAEYISDIKTSGIHLLSIINEILDLSKIEAGKEDLYKEEIDVNGVMNSAARLVRPHAQEKSIQFNFNINDDEIAIVADERAIKQVILNLLSNAIKFTDVGGTIAARVSHSENQVIIEIEDSGIGIPADQLEMVTEPFVQLQSTLTNGNAGTGLGLSIATRLAELHGGRIELSSVVNEGTTARLFLPVISDERIEL